MTIKSRRSLREDMPIAAELVDCLREAFGQDYIDGLIRRGRRGEPVFFVREGQFEFGTRLIQGDTVPWDRGSIRPDKSDE